MISFVQACKKALSGELPVKAQCLPFRQIPHTTQLFTRFPFLVPFHPAFLLPLPTFFRMVQRRNSGDEL